MKVEFSIHLKLHLVVWISQFIQFLRSRCCSNIENICMAWRFASNSMTNPFLFDFWFYSNIWLIVGLHLPSVFYFCRPFWSWLFSFTKFKSNLISTLFRSTYFSFFVEKVRHLSSFHPSFVGRHIWSDASTTRNSMRSPSFLLPMSFVVYSKRYHFGNHFRFWVFIFYSLFFSISFFLVFFFLLFCFLHRSLSNLSTTHMSNRK